MSIKVYCIHHWVKARSKSLRCKICREPWDLAKHKSAPKVVIGILPAYAPVFATPDPSVIGKLKIR